MKKRIISIIVFAFMLVYFTGLSAFAQTSAAEEELLAILRSKTDGELLGFTSHDFDGDGSVEAFAFIGEYDNTQKIFSGELWFCSRTEAVPLDTGDFTLVCKMYKHDGYSFIVLERYYSTSTLSEIWTVKNGSPAKDEASSHAGGLTRTDDGSYTMTVTELDKSDDMTGRTWKEYYFYWNPAEGAMHEYGGVEIDAEALRKYGGAEEILSLIDQIGNLETIYYRSNNIVHINYKSGDENCNVTLRIDENTVEPIIYNQSAKTTLSRYDQGGVFKDALAADIAIYPDALPAPAEEPGPEHSDISSQGSSLSAEKENNTKKIILICVAAGAVVITAVVFLLVKRKNK